MKELTCIVCPKGCRLKVDEEKGYAVTGNACERGREYGEQELTNPMRVVTSTVRVKGGIHNRLPVKTSAAIPRRFVFDCVKLLEKVEVRAPIVCSQVIVKDIFGLGVDIVATRGM